MAGWGEGGTLIWRQDQVGGGLYTGTTVGSPSLTGSPEQVDNCSLQNLLLGVGGGRLGVSAYHQLLANFSWILDVLDLGFSASRTFSLVASLCCILGNFLSPM